MNHESVRQILQQPFSPNDSGHSTLDRVIAVGELVGPIQLRGSPLHLISHKLPEVALDLRNRLHQLLCLLGRLQIVVVLGSLAHVGLELRGVVVVFHALLAGLADGACTLAMSVRVRVAQMHIVLGAEADLVDGGGDARGVADEAAVDGGIGEVGGLAVITALLVEVFGDLVPRKFLLCTQSLDDYVLVVFFDVATGARLLILRLKDRDVVGHLDFDGACALESIHIAVVGADLVDGSIEVRLAV
jgi:hypothetical protein